MPKLKNPKEDTKLLRVRESLFNLLRDMSNYRNMPIADYTEEIVKGNIDYNDELKYNLILKNIDNKDSVERFIKMRYIKFENSKLSKEEYVKKHKREYNEFLWFRVETYE